MWNSIFINGNLIAGKPVDVNVSYTVLGFRDIQEVDMVIPKVSMKWKFTLVFYDCNWKNS